ncbi:hypothetical protein TRVL_02844 [Trypanosoma vivax]|uniref:CS domain-containing protein n=1 Tax=Trypanosoma vivax (strain Y486) TaxID=1055687 RepID=G0U5Q9_TRYVY|nr:hypothetical protein TRVL_02844 [Trypanosoma vivax]CCC51210.1 conserved hypothetical protein [Trypanosoma vivax Y486]
MSESTEVMFPDILWAQRPEVVLLTVPLQDAGNVVVEVREGRLLHFEAVSGGQRFRCDLELFREVESEESRHVTLPRQIEIQLRKKQAPKTSTDTEVDECRVWPRLIRDKVKNSHIQVDWSRWRDDDESEEDFNGMDGMGYNDLMAQMMSQKLDNPDSELMQGEVMGNDWQEPKDTSPDNGDDSCDDLPPLEQ